MLVPSSRSDSCVLFTPGPSIKPAVVREWCLLDIHNFWIMGLSCADGESNPEWGRLSCDAESIRSQWNICAVFMFVCSRPLLSFGASICKSAKATLEMYALYCSCIVRVGKWGVFLLHRMTETRKVYRNARKYVAESPFARPRHW
jgi:hypothetical protein